MLKIIVIIIFMFILPIFLVKNFNKIVIFVISFLWFFKFFPLFLGVYLRENFYISKFSFVLTFLVFLIGLRFILNLSVKNKIIFSLRWILLFIILLFFLINNILVFFILFELSLIPIIFIIFFFGYQPERIIARFILFLYTVFGSLPLMIILLILYRNDLWYFFLIKKFEYNFFLNRGILFLLRSLGFLCKFPIIIFHAWLPIAHVEAPIEGSIILAALMLKIGGIGIYQFIYFINFFRKLQNLLFFCNLLSIIIISYICLVIIDMKLIIAYSSVGHISICIIRFFFSSDFIFVRCIIILVIHGLVSSLIFYIRYCFYSLSNSRNLFFNKNFKIFTYYIVIIFFFSLIFNIGGPFTLNLLVEFLFVISVLNISEKFFFLIFIVLIVNVLFNINLFRFIYSKLRSFRLIYNQNIRLKFYLVRIYYTLIIFIIRFLIFIF